MLFSFSKTHTRANSQKVNPLLFFTVKNFLKSILVPLIWAISEQIASKGTAFPVQATPGEIAVYFPATRVLIHRWFTVFVALLGLKKDFSA